MEVIIYFVLLALAAEILGTIGGFGSSMFFVPIAGLFFDFHSVLGITALFHLSSNVAKIALFKKGVDKKLILQIGIPAVLFVVAGAFLSRYIDSRSLEVTLSIVLITLSLLLILFRNFHFKPTLFNSVGGGALSGITAGLLGTGGAIRGLTLSAFSLKKEVFIATSAVIDLGIDFSRSLVYFSNGYIHSHDLHLVPILLVVGFLGTLIGKSLLRKISEANFRSFVLILILAVGVSTLSRLLFT